MLKGLYGGTVNPDAISADCDASKPYGYNEQYHAPQLGRVQ